MSMHGGHRHLCGLLLHLQLRQHSFPVASNLSVLPLLETQVPSSAPESVGVVIMLA